MKPLANYFLPILILLLLGCTKEEQLDPIVLETNLGVWHVVSGTQDSIKVLEQDDEYVWAGTESNGLIKINKETFEVERIDKSNSGLRSNRITSLAYESSGERLWIGTQNSGLMSYRSDVWAVYDSLNGSLYNDHVTDIALFDVDVWVGTKSGLSRFNGNLWTTYFASITDLPSDDISKIAVSQYGALWVGTNDAGLMVGEPYNGAVYNTFNSPIKDNQVRAVAVDQSGIGYVATFNTYYKKDSYLWEEYDMTNSGIPSEFINAIVPDDDGTIYYATHGGFAYENRGSWTSYNSGNSPLPHNITDDCIIDEQGNVWIATFDGIAIYNPDGIRQTNVDALRSEIARE